MHLISESLRVELGFDEPSYGNLVVDTNNTDPVTDLNKEKGSKKIGTFYTYENPDKTLSLNIAQFLGDEVNLSVGIWCNGVYSSDNIRTTDEIIEALSKAGYHLATNYKRKQFIDTVITELNVLPIQPI